jgi:hypothetical protein
MKEFQLNYDLKEDIKLVLNIQRYRHPLVKYSNKILFVYNGIKSFVEKALKSVITDFDIEEGSVYCKIIIPDDSELFFDLKEDWLYDVVYIKTFNINNIKLSRE